MKTKQNNNSNNNNKNQQLDSHHLSGALQLFVVNFAKKIQEIPTFENIVGQQQFIVLGNGSGFKMTVNVVC